MNYELMTLPTTTFTGRKLHSFTEHTNATKHFSSSASSWYVNHEHFRNLPQS